MELTNRFTLPIPPEQAWGLLLDFERMARAMPGATLTRVQGDRLEGQVVVRLGPMRITYQGEATVVERDPDNGRLLIEAKGRESRGAGTAALRVETVIARDDHGTLVTINSVVDVTGRPAQMGAGMIQEVGQNLTDEFARRLASELATEASGDPGSTAPKEMSPRDDASSPTRSEDALDVGSAVAGPILRRLAPALIMVALALGLALLIRVLWG